MKRSTETNICILPVALWLVVIPLIVKMKLYENPLSDYPWYYPQTTLSDFFLYYKSLFVTATGVLMLVFLCWQVSQMRRKDTLINADTRIFLPAIGYLALAVLSSLFSDYGYFCTHGMPDQFETIWNLTAYVVAACYCYYIIVYHDSEKQLLTLVFTGAALVGLICVLQYFKVDIYRLIYAGEGYEFTFQPGQVYGPFYNINYVGFYTLLFFPWFLMLCIFCKDLRVRVAAGVLAVALLLSMVGAQSSTSWIAMAGIFVFMVFFFLLRHAREKKLFWLPVILLVVGALGVCIIAAPKIGAYVKACDIEKTDLEQIFTNDDNVEIDYKGQKLSVRMLQSDDLVAFILTDQDQNEVGCEYAASDEGYYYTITDERFSGITLTPVITSQDPLIYGFIAQIDGKNWCFTNQMTEDGFYYYYNDLGKLTRLTADTVSADFAPLVHLSGLASGRGYLWNKTAVLLEDYLFLGSGADTFTLAYPNGDFVDKYNNAYDNTIITKPHNMYLQTAVQTGVLSLICFLVFYLWYLISSLRLYFRQRFDSLLTVTGFSIMIGTMGYMISGLANDSTVSIAPLYWALLGIGIGINHRIRSAQS